MRVFYKKILPIILVIVGMIIVLIALKLGVNSKSSGDILNETYSISQDFNQIEVSTDISVVSISLGEKDEIRVNGVKDKSFTFDIANNILKINYKDKSWFNHINISLPFMNYQEDNKIEITISKNKLEKLKVKSGVGEYTVKGIEVSDLKIDHGTGELSLHSVTAQNSDIEVGLGDVQLNNSDLGTLKLDIGTGELKMKSCNLSQSDIEIGLGDMEFNGDILGDVKIDIGAGVLDMFVDNDIENYYFDIEGGISDISINGEKSHTNNNYKYKITANLGLGNAKIETERGLL